MTDRQLLVLTTALLRVADLLSVEIYSTRVTDRAQDATPLPMREVVDNAREVIAAVDRVLAPNQPDVTLAAAVRTSLGRAPAAVDLDVLVMAPERLDAMLAAAVEAYEASLTATLDRQQSLTRDDRVIAMRAALAAAFWGSVPR